MNQSPDLKLKSTILKGLHKDPASVLATLTDGISDDRVSGTIKELLDALATTVHSEQTIQQRRKTLSRQIGAARKTENDCGELISQVSHLSDQINNLNSDIKAKIIDIEFAISSAVPTQESQKPQIPLHLYYTPDYIGEPDSGLTVHHSSQLDADKLRSLTDSISHSTIYHDPGWQQIIQNNFGHPLHYITCSSDKQELLGVLPLVHLKSRLFGSFTISMPYFNYGGPLAVNTSVERALLSAAASFSDKNQCSHMEIRETRPRKEWKSVQRKVSMILPLPESDDKLDSALGSKIRAQINKSAKNHLEVKFGSKKMLNCFYKVFSRNMRDLGTPVYGKQFFAEILNTFPENAFICVVYRHGKPLAAGFLLGYKDKLEIPWASSIKSQNHLGANMLMYRSILKEAIARDYQFFDFGRSTKQASTYKFKKQWGAVEHPLHWHYWTRDNADVPEINPDNPKYKLVIAAWRLLPVFVTTIIGPYIARNLP